MKRKKIFVVFFLFLFSFLIISGCRIGEEEKQEKKYKKETKGFFIFFARGNKKRKAKASVIWQMSPNGKDQKKASFGGEPVYAKGSFSISKDGRKIAWSPPAIFSGIDVTDRDGLERETILRADPSVNKEYLEPAFSPDGKRIAFTAIEWKEPGIRMLQAYNGRINLDKSDLTTFIPNPYEAKFVSQPDYSPDSSEIVLAVKFSDKISQVVVINSISGEMIRELASREFFDSEPVYTPDGENIVFVSNRGGGRNIFIMKKDGTGVKQLTSKKSNDNPSISPDGKQIAFSSNRNGNWEIYMMRIDGSKQKRLTKNKVDDFYPEWGKAI